MKRQNNTTENNELLELEQILTFLGINFINYKGKRTSNGHRTAKTIGEIKDFFGKEVMTSGQFIEDIKLWDFKNNWNDLMFLVAKIESLGADIIIRAEYTTLIYDEGEQISTLNFNSKIDSVYNACVEFVKWYNNNK